MTCMDYRIVYITECAFCFWTINFQMVYKNDSTFSMKSTSKQFQVYYRTVTFKGAYCSGIRLGQGLV